VKNQHFGDVGDYVKYGLLRVLTEHTRLRLGIVWMLTPDDDRNDASRVAYRNDPLWRVHDPELFDRLARLSTSPGARNVELFRRWDLVPGSLGVEAPLPGNAAARAEWMASALAALAGCPLVFFDPDSGFEPDPAPSGHSGASRHLCWDEAAAAFDAGHSLIVQQHWPREDHDAFEARLLERAGRRLRGAHVRSLRAAHALFLIAARAEHAAALEAAAGLAAQRWSGRLAAPAAALRRDHAADLEAVCEALDRGGTSAAQAALAARLPRRAAASTARVTFERDALRVWLRDGFLDRYDGARLAFPGALRLLSARLPEAFPFRPGEPWEASHPAWALLCATVDPVVPLERGGAEGPENLATTSVVNRARKAHWTLAELGWTLRPGGDLEEWDGLVGWFRATLAAQPELLRADGVRRWAALLDRERPAAPR